MLGKKSLAIALMGLGLAGSCFAATEDTSTTTVTFNATVQAVPCTFTVSEVDNGGNSGNAVNFGEVPWSKTLFPKEKMEFKLTCQNGLSFNTVEITGASDSSSTVETSLKAKFVVYDEEDLQTVWQAKSNPIKFNREDSTFTAYKWVQFQMDDNTKTGQHIASVTYTATYE